MEQNLDITERLTLKRPYYTLTSDDLSEAAAEIIELRRTVLRLEAQYGVQAKKAEDLEKKIEAIKEGYEGCCTACEPVALLNRQLREERDLARREVCRWEANHLSKTVTECARLNEWDCFKAERK
jgi:dsDNA-specific endonuclease/ATPase MutS2